MYPEPNSLDDIYGVGAERADAFAAAQDEATERALKAGVSYATILGVLNTLADAQQKDNADRAADLANAEVSNPPPQAK